MADLNNDTTIFTCSAFVTRPSAVLIPPENKSNSSFELVVGGRPDLKSEVQKVSQWSDNMASLVYVCGPISLVDEAEVLTQQFQTDFKHETFEL